MYNMVKPQQTTYKKTPVGTIPYDWDYNSLSNISTVLLSNVDKKININEKSVRLCNYLDVLNNNYLHNGIQFSQGTVNENEYDKFSLKKNDVIITKDSETKPDIASSSVVIDTLFDVVCGYHLAIIRPSSKIDSIYLSNVLQLSHVHQQFVNAANGITRFGISQSVINNSIIPIPPLSEQQSIATILSTIEDAITITKSIITRTEELKRGLMQQLLTRGIDKNGQIRNERTHKFKDSPVGRIPVEWEACNLGKIAILQRGYDITKNKFLEGLYPVVSSSGIIGYHNQKTSNGPNVIVGRKGTIGEVHYINTDFWAHDTSLYVTNFFGNNERFIYYLFIFLDLARFGTKSGSPSLNRNDIHPILIGLPSKKEQEKIANILHQIQSKIISEKKELEVLIKLKQILMSDLLTGRVRVPLPEVTTYDP